MRALNVKGAGWMTFDPLNPTQVVSQLFVSVTDTDGSPVMGLSKSSFYVGDATKENGVLVPIGVELLRVEDSPLPGFYTVTTILVGQTPQGFGHVMAVTAYLRQIQAGGVGPKGVPFIDSVLVAQGATVITLEKLGS